MLSDVKMRIALTLTVFTATRNYLILHYNDTCRYFQCCEAVWFFFFFFLHRSGSWIVVILVDARYYQVILLLNICKWEHIEACKSVWFVNTPIIEFWYTSLFVQGLQSCLLVMRWKSFTDCELILYKLTSLLIFNW